MQISNSLRKLANVCLSCMVLESKELRKGEREVGKGSLNGNQLLICLRGSIYVLPQRHFSFHRSKTFSSPIPFTSYKNIHEQKEIIKKNHPYQDIFHCSPTPSLPQPTIPFPHLISRPLPLTPTPVPSVLRTSHLFPCPGTISVSLLGSSLFPSFSGAVDCGLVILCFTSRIHLGVSTDCVCFSGPGLPHSG